MWLTFSTVAGGIYFHEFENAHLFQWIALVVGMCLNYIGLYYLVPAAADQPMVIIINMEKPQKNKKVDDDDDDEPSKSDENVHKSAKKIHKFKIEKNDNHKYNICKARSYSYSHDGIIDNDTEHETDEDDDDTDCHINDIEKEEVAPLLQSKGGNCSQSSNTVSWYQAFFV